MSINRILISINVRWWNAEAAYALNLALGLQAAGCQVWMIVNPDSPVHQKAVAKGVSVITDIQLDSASPVTHARNLKRLLAVIDTHHIQLINSFKSKGSFLFGLVQRKRPGVLHVKTRGEARPPRRNVFNRILYGGCDGIVAVGTPVLNWLADLGLKDQWMKVIHYGDTGMERPPQRLIDEVRKELGIADTAIVLTLLGRTQPVKGHRLLLEAVAALENEPIHLLLLVKDPKEFPEELQFLETYIASNKLQESVTILGFQDNLARVLSVTDLGVIPSLDSEVNCRVTVEFFSMGMPVLSFPTGSLPDIIEHETNGFLTRDKTVAELVRGVRWFLSDSHNLKACGEQAKKDFTAHYTLEQMTAKTLDFFQSCSK